MERRQFIQLIAASSLTPSLSAVAQERALTIEQTEGPYYPVEPITASNNLLLNDQFIGSELHLSGAVLKENGKTVDNARVEIWQCDGRGTYLHPAAPNTRNFDSNFRGAGATTTDATGRYQFITIVPVPYTGRPPHIHTKVFVQGKEQLTSQIYLRDSGGDQRLKIDPVASASSIYTAGFDFVIRT